MDELLHEWIPLSPPDLSGLEKEMLVNAVEDGWISSSGPRVDEFADLVKAYTGSRFAVPVQSGTAALHLSLIVCGIGPGDKVVVPNLSFVVAANAVKYVGAEPLLIDVNPVDWQIDLDLLEERLKVNKGNIKAIIAVHVLGYLTDMERLSRICKENGIILIEDAAEAMGSWQAAKHAGTFGDIGILSFNGNKLVSTGGGGMILTSDPGKATRSKHLSNQARLHPYEYLHDEVGYNYRMTNLAAAIGCAQMQRIDSLLASRKANFDAYSSAISAHPEISIHPGSGDPAYLPNHWLSTILHPSARELEEFLHVHSIETRKLWIPMNRLSMYADCEYWSEKDHSYQIYEHSLSIPSGSNLSVEERDRVIQSIGSFEKVRG